MVVHIFLLLGLIFGLFYASAGDEIYDTHAKKTWAIKTNVALQRFLGGFTGWLVMWLLLDKRLDIFCNMPFNVHLNFVDVLIFLVALLGIFGHLPNLLANLTNFLGGNKK
jgi:hypothetical protein